MNRHVVAIVRRCTVLRMGKSKICIVERRLARRATQPDRRRQWQATRIQGTLYPRWRLAA